MTPDSVSIPAAAPRYWAFICYRPEDAKLARRLHESLETYRIPRHLVGKSGHQGVIPKRVFPVFLDSEELPLRGQRGEDIKFALEQSRHLIAICSNGPGDFSEMDEQIRYFKSVGRGGRIICLLAEGARANPDLSREDRDMLPPAIRSDDSVELILVRFGQHSTLEILAHLSGVAFDDLQQRDAERRHRRLQIWLTVISIILCIFGLLIVELYRRGNIEAWAERELQESNRQLHAAKAELERIKRNMPAKGAD